MTAIAETGSDGGLLYHKKFVNILFSALNRDIIRHTYINKVRTLKNMYLLIREGYLYGTIKEKREKVT